MWRCWCWSVFGLEFLGCEFSPFGEWIPCDPSQRRGLRRAQGPLEPAPLTQTTGYHWTLAFQSGLRRGYTKGRQEVGRSLPRLFGSVALLLCLQYHTQGLTKDNQRKRCMFTRATLALSRAVSMILRGLLTPWFSDAQSWVLVPLALQLLQPENRKKNPTGALCPQQQLSTSQGSGLERPT
ncbi:hypothetical protein MJG53_002278 [Ovis ammon polii x Ovis aries]|uniref:Uncharacterized protein n=1 Tax=Ovis ammon polii x Ovis aries TaxID=2918886 RepID=A0ACB9VMG6_9CETA|nr:hypothetical protein MJG53_002278 [Ovis ammon polii x Ovis aries]